MKISLAQIKAGGSCFTAVERDGCLYLDLANDDRANFNIIVRRLLDTPSPDYTALARSDGSGGYDSVQIIQHDLVLPAAPTQPA
jgi:hypothetical protein